MPALIHTCYRILDVDRSVAFYEALGFEEVGRLPIRDEAVNVFMGMPDDGPRLELTCNHGQEEPCEIGTGYGHIAITLLGIVPSARAGDGVEHLTYRIGPLQITPGQNRISYRPIRADEKPSENGWIVGFRPNLVRADGTVPRTDHVMFHHGVWLNL